MDDFSRWLIIDFACRVAPRFRSKRRIEKSSSQAWSGASTFNEASGGGNAEADNDSGTAPTRVKERLIIRREVGVEARTTSMDCVGSSAYVRVLLVMPGRDEDAGMSADDRQYIKVHTSWFVVRLSWTKTRISDRPLISVEVDEIADEILTLLDATIEPVCVRYVIGWIWCNSLVPF